MRKLRYETGLRPAHVLAFFCHILALKVYFIVKAKQKFERLVLQKEEKARDHVVNRGFTESSPSCGSKQTRK